MRNLTIALTALALLWSFGPGCSPGQLVLDHSESGMAPSSDASSWRQIARSGELRGRGFNGPFDVQFEETAEADGEASGASTYSTWATEGLSSGQVNAWLSLPTGQRVELSDTAFTIDDGELRIAVPSHPAGTRLTVRYGLRWEGALDGLRWSFQGPKPLASSEFVALLPTQAQIRTKVQRSPGSLTPEYESQARVGPEGQALTEHRWRIVDTTATKPGWSTAVVVWSAGPIPKMPARFQIMEPAAGSDRAMEKMRKVHPVDRRVDPRRLRPKAIKPKAR